MRTGKLLAMDTPKRLKQDVLPGVAWDVRARPLLPAIAALEPLPGVLRVGLSGNHLRVITGDGASKRTLADTLKTAGLSGVQIERVEPDLEDVFLALARV
jgi:hypothetical protein